jgi:hypothetical protein
MYYIYALKQNEVIKYIGQTINPIKRKCAHKNTRDNHEFEIIFSTEDKETAKQKEIEFIAEYSTYCDGWNKSPGGEGFEDYSREGIGGVKKGYIPWNKNKKGCFSEETISHFSNIRKGKIWKPSKLNASDVIYLRELYNKEIEIDGVGQKMKNGKYMSYTQAFSIKYAEVYKTTKENIRRIIERKTWTNV